MLKTVSSITNAIGALNYKGTWNASTNTPTLASGAGTKGDYYVVSVAGSTSLDGISNWGIGDWVTFNGTAWQRVEGGADGNFVNLSATGTSTLGVTTATNLKVNGAANIAGTPIEVLGNLTGYSRSASVTTVGQVGQGYTTPTTNGQTFTFSTASAKLFLISTGGGAGAIVFADYKSTLISLLANPSNEFEASSTPGAGKTGIFKSANAHAISIVNNTGSAVNYSVVSLGPVTSTTDPA